MKQQGYPMSRKAWAKVIKRGKVKKEEGRREREAARNKGGRPTKLTQPLINVAKRVLAGHTKPGSKVAHVHKNKDGTFGQPRSRGSQANEAVVPGESLLTAPKRLWRDNAALHTQMSLPTFYKLMRQNFAQVRKGHRCTDICSHCQCFWKHIEPRFHRDWKKIQEDLKTVYPSTSFITPTLLSRMLRKKPRLRWSMFAGIAVSTDRKEATAAVTCWSCLLSQRHLQRYFWRDTYLSSGHFCGTC